MALLFIISAKWKGCFCTFWGGSSKHSHNFEMLVFVSLVCFLRKAPEIRYNIENMKKTNHSLFNFNTFLWLSFLCFLCLKYFSTVKLLGTLWFYVQLNLIWKHQFIISFLWMLTELGIFNNLLWRSSIQVHSRRIIQHFNYCWLVGIFAWIEVN